MKLHWIPAISLSIAFAPVCLATDLELGKTEIQFTLHDVLHTVHGTFQLKRGAIRFAPESGKASGEIVVEVASGASGNEARDRRMHKAILESQRYPEAIFTPDQVTGKLAPEGQSQIDVRGNFKIHGADHELMLHFQVDRAGNEYVASTHFSIPYVQWGMKDPSTFLLKVDKTVDIDIKTTMHARS